MDVLTLELMGFDQQAWWLLLGFAATLSAMLALWFQRSVLSRVYLWGMLGLHAVLLSLLTICLATNVFPTPWPQAALFLGTLLLAVWNLYLRSYQALGKGRWGVLTSLRMLGIVLLACLLIQPVLTYTLTPPQRRQIVLALDSSASMGYVDHLNQPQRYRQATLALKQLASQIQSAYAMECVVMGSAGGPARKIAPERLDTIAPDGAHTDLAALLLNATASTAQSVVLFSDGIHNSGDLSATLAEIKIPIRTVMIGDPQAESGQTPDIAVLHAECPLTVPLDTTSNITVTVRSQALSDRVVPLLLEQGKEQLGEKQIVLHSGAKPQTVEIPWTPTKLGRNTVRLRIPHDPSERTAINNEIELTALVIQPRIRVLYVEGRVRPEVGPLRRALEQDPQLQTTTLIQTQAGKFILAGQNTSNDPELTGLPQTKEQWGKYKVVIFGDLDSSYLTMAQGRDINACVTAGQGLLMIGGQHSFGPGNWQQNPIAEVLPVDIAPQNPAQINAAFVPQLTGLGLQHVTMKGLETFFMSPDKTLPPQAVPALSGCVAVGAAKPTGTVVLQHPQIQIANQPANVLVVGPVGKGRTAAFTADTTWQWNLYLRSMGRQSPYYRFWGQLVRWLAGQEDMQRTEGASLTPLISRNTYELGDTIPFRCAVTDANGQATAYAQVKVTILDNQKREQTLNLVNLPEQVGIYTGSWQPPTKGTYNVFFQASKDGQPLAQDQGKFELIQTEGELDRIAANPALMVQIAQQTGGMAIDLQGINALGDKLLAQLPPEQLAKKKSYVLYNFRYFFFAGVLIFTLEWYLRRRWQLA